MNKFIKIGIIIGTSLLSIALYAALCISLYNHRIIDSKENDVVAIITEHEYQAQYTTRVIRSAGKFTYFSNINHPAQYKLKYTVNFNNNQYYETESVSKEYYNNHKDGQKIEAIFLQEFRADGTETYKIYLAR